MEKGGHQWKKIAWFVIRKSIARSFHATNRLASPRHATPDILCTRCFEGEYIFDRRDLYVMQTNIVIGFGHGIGASFDLPVSNTTQYFSWIEFGLLPDRIGSSRQDIGDYTRTIESTSSSNLAALEHPTTNYCWENWSVTECLFDRFKFTHTQLSRIVFHFCLAAKKKEKKDLVLVLLECWLAAFYDRCMRLSDCCACYCCWFCCCCAFTNCRPNRWFLVCHFGLRVYVSWKLEWVNPNPMGSFRVTTHN